ncbi:histidine phosphatase superfamily protein (branch 1) [Nonomuraea fuscirosea]|uniref:Histidine phosphatase superfamily protein (Branch 1) n=1 Tax=Nonomuraea fuscirosea TaxID=1291556 RepID=A0A2T0LPP7_9ACTN|nr:histidine phosphatase family protein [Nonomuraea fuscirosea]PRX45327.1 histidine phosphatase superfamily protein (branch 1) [Nonomuraea fuscirosea]
MAAHGKSSKADHLGCAAADRAPNCGTGPWHASFVFRSHPNHGDADGKVWHEVKTAFRGGPHAHPDQPWAAGSDTWNGYLQRAGAAVADLVRAHQGERVLFAAHGETVLAAHVLLLELGVGVRTSFTVDHASITHWQLHRDRFGARTLDAAMPQRQRAPARAGTPMTRTDDDLLAVARDQLGPVTPIQRFDLPSRVQLLVAGDGQRYILKRHDRPGRYRAEADAYSSWVPSLGGNAPTLIHADPDSLSLLLTVVPGRHATQLQEGSTGELRAYREAGRVLRLIHQAPPGPHAGTRAPAHLAERMRWWAIRAVGSPAPSRARPLWRHRRSAPPWCAPSARAETGHR